MNDTRLFKRLFAYMKPYLLRYVVAIVFMIIIVGIDVISPLLISASLAELVNEVIDFNKIVMYFKNSVNSCVYYSLFRFNIINVCYSIFTNNVVTLYRTKNCI